MVEIVRIHRAWIDSNTMLTNSACAPQAVLCPEPPWHEARLVVLNIPEVLMCPSMPPRLRSPVWALLLTAACVLSAARGQQGEPPTAENKVKPAEAPRVELHRLPNDELLKQAGGIFDKASQDYLATARGLAAAEVLLDEAA